MIWSDRSDSFSGESDVYVCMNKQRSPWSVNLFGESDIYCYKYTSRSSWSNRFLVKSDIYWYMYRKNPDQTDFLSNLTGTDIW